MVKGVLVQMEMNESNTLTVWRVSVWLQVGQLALFCLSGRLMTSGIWDSHRFLLLYPPLSPSLPLSFPLHVLLSLLFSDFIIIIKY